MASHGTRGLLKQTTFDIELILIFFRILHLRWFSEGKRLHQLHMISVITVDPGQGGLPHLSQLLLAELAGVAGAVVVEPDKEIIKNRDNQDDDTVEQILLLCDDKS